MGATLVRPDILAAISKGEHSSTFGGNPISCAAGLAALTSITEDGLIEEGVLMLYSGRNILRILPPLVIKEEDVTKVLHALDVVITKEEQKRDV